MDYGRSYRDSTRKSATKATAMVDREAEKEKYRKYHLQRQKEERDMIETYRTGDQIVLEELSMIKPFVRKLFLSWIGKAMITTDNVITTEYGDVIEVELNPNKKITLTADDGELLMPAVTFKFLNKEKR
jgi:hypothetical protein